MAGWASVIATRYNKDRPVLLATIGVGGDAPPYRRLLALHGALPREDSTKGSNTLALRLPLFKDPDSLPLNEMWPSPSSVQPATLFLRNEPIFRVLHQRPRRHPHLWPGVAGRCPWRGGRPGGAEVCARPCRTCPLSLFRSGRVWRRRSLCLHPG